MKITMRDRSGVLNLRFLVEDVDRHGNVRVYLRRNGRKVRLHERPGTEAFMVEYRCALAGPTPDGPAPPRKAPPGSLRRLIELYYGSAEFQLLKRGHVRRQILDKLCEQHGDKPYARLESQHVRQLRDERASHPEAANARVKALRAVFGWGIEAGHTQTNPARDVPYLRSGSDGFHTWTVEEVRQFEARHHIGTKPRLALDLLLLTGVRRSDAVKLGRQMERDGWLQFTETKGVSRKVKVRAVPLLPALRTTIEATPSGHLTYLVTAFGKPFTANGFGNWFRRHCDEAGLPHCSAHGLRKAGATIAAERGATEHQLMAIYGWESPKQAAIYTRKADRRKLAGDAMHLIEPERKKDATVPLSDGEVSHRSAKG
jgi:integrase